MMAAPEKASKEETRSGLVTYTRAVAEASGLIAGKYEAGWKRREGQPVAWLMGGPPPEILECFDVHAVYPEQYGALCAERQATSPFLEYGEEDGFSTNICGYLRIALGYARCLARDELPVGAVYGGMPRPQMLLSASRTCDPRSKIFEAMRRYLDVPAFIFDTQKPPNEEPRCQDEKACEHYIQHNMEGVKGLVTFLEEQTGKKLDRDRLLAALRNSIEMWHVGYSIDELRKHSPCPLPSGDFFSLFSPLLAMGHEPEGLQFARNLHRELEERIRSGISVVPEEKFRLLWLGQPPFFDMELFNYLEGLGTVSVMESIYHSSRPRELSLSDPIRALVERTFWGGDWGESDGTQLMCGITPGSRVLRLARDYNVDGVIAHSTISCRAVSMGHKHMAKLLREQMGLPVLYLESDMVDPRSYSPAEVRENVDAFIHILRGRK